MLVVPFTSDYDQTFQVQLEGDRYVIDARWNERAQVWYIDVTRDSDQELLIAGVPLLSGQEILGPYALGIGGLIVTDLSNSNTDPGPDDLGDRVQVLFFNETELAILKAAGIPGIITSALPPSASGGTGSGGGGGSGGGTGVQTITTIVTGTTVVNTTINNLNVTGGGFSTQEERDDDSGNEVLVFIWPFNASANPNPTLTAIAALLVSGNGTLRAYVGGSFEAIGSTGTPSGTLVDTVAISGSAPKWVSGTPVTNIGGLLPMKLTIQSSGPGTDVSVGFVNGAVG